MVQSVPESKVCPHCGSECGIFALANGCGFGRFEPPVDAPVALIDGHPANLDDAVDRAAAILAAARYPLIYGLTELPCEAQRAAVALGDRIGGCIDFADAAPAPLFPDLGTVTCSLGEIKNRADLTVFWGGRPDLTHPRLATDYALDPVGRFVPAGRRGRKVIVVGEQGSADAYCADEFLPTVAGPSFAALWLLRALVQGKPVNPAENSVDGVPVSNWKTLADSLKQCKFGVLVIDPRHCGRRATEAAHGLATDLNAFTRLYVLTLRRPGNGVGAEQVLTWQTGYSAAVGLSAGYPRSFAAEYSAERVLNRGEADAVLIAGADGLEQLSSPAREHLRRIPVVALSSRIASLPTPANVAITTSVCANPAGGTAFRADGIALPVRPAFSSSFPDDFQVLQRIETAVRREG